MNVLATEWENATPEPPEGDETFSKDTLPAIRSAMDLVADDEIVEPKEIIVGILHRTCKATLGGASKARKTWTLIDLGISVAAGVPFWKWETNRGKVLLINFEVHEAFIKKRIAKVASVKEVSDYSGFDVWTLRGRAAPLWRLLPALVERIKDKDYSLIEIDPVYKLRSGDNENGAGETTEFCNEIEKLAVQTGAAVIYSSHFSKGNQSSKNAMDRISGSGVYARDPDTILTLTEHKTANCYTVDAILRNHPEQEPFVIEWKYPLMQLAETLNAKDLKRPGPPPDNDPQDLLDCLPSGGLVNKDWIEAADTESAITERTFYRLRKELVKTGKVLKSKVNGKWMPIIK